MRRSALRDRLIQLGWPAWYKSAAGASYFEDPWLAFESARQAISGQSGALRVIAELFLLRDTVLKSDAKSALGGASLSWLEDQGILISDANESVFSRMCMQVAFDRLLFVDWPLQTPSDHLLCQQTYLSRGTFDCIQFALRSGPLTSALDLGCGTGLVAMAMTERASRVTAIDIEERAVWLSRINLRMNGLIASVVQESWANLPRDKQRYDLVVGNPPWRIVPPGISYPDPVARVGPGLGGLGKVVEVIRLLPHILSGDGRAAIRFDLPIDGSGDCPFLPDLETMLGLHMKREIITLGRTSVPEQARTSADNCAHLNPDVDRLADRFAKHYDDLGIVSLQQVMLVVTTTR